MLNAMNASDGQAYGYQYDDLNRLTTSYVYDGDDIQAEYISWSAPQAFYVQGAGTDEPLVRQTGGNSTRQFYHQNGLGSLMAISNNAAALDANQRFDAWGNVAASSGTIAQYGYTGREPDHSGCLEGQGTGSCCAHRLWQSGFRRR